MVPRGTLARPVTVSTFRLTFAYVQETCEDMLGPLTCAAISSRALGGAVVCPTPRTTSGRRGPCKPFTQPKFACVRAGSVQSAVRSYPGDNIPKEYPLPPEGNPVVAPLFPAKPEALGSPPLGMHAVLCRPSLAGHGSRIPLIGSADTRHTTYGLHLSIQHTAHLFRRSACLHRPCRTLQVHIYAVNHRSRMLYFAQGIQRCGYETRALHSTTRGLCSPPLLLEPALWAHELQLQRDPAESRRTASHVRQREVEDRRRVERGV